MKPVIARRREPRGAFLTNVDFSFFFLSFSFPPSHRLIAPNSAPSNAELPSFERLLQVGYLGDERLLFFSRPTWFYWQGRAVKTPTFNSLFASPTCSRHSRASPVAPPHSGVQREYKAAAAALSVASQRPLMTDCRPDTSWNPSRLTKKTRALRGRRNTGGAQTGLGLLWQIWVWGLTPVMRRLISPGIVLTKQVSVKSEVSSKTKETA